MLRSSYQDPQRNVVLGNVVYLAPSTPPSPFVGRIKSQPGQLRLCKPNQSLLCFTKTARYIYTSQNGTSEYLYFQPLFVGFPFCFHSVHHLFIHSLLHTLIDSSTMYLFPFFFQSSTSPASMSTPFLFSTITILTALVSPCKAYVDWLYPPSSSSNALAFNYNDVVYFTWDSNFSTPAIALWCARNDQYYSRKFSSCPISRTHWQMILPALCTFPLSIHSQLPHPSPALHHINQSHLKPTRQHLLTCEPSARPTVYTANTTTNGTTPQSFPYADSFNQSCHMSLYCNSNSDPQCQPAGHPSPEFSLLHNHAAAAQTWGLSATKEVGKAAATSTSGIATGTGTGTETPAAAKTAAASASTARSAVTGTATATPSGGGLSTGAKAGIGVGVAVGAIVGFAAVGLIVVRARSKRREGITGRDGSRGPKMMSELGYSGHPGWMGPPRQEMDGEGKRGELGGTPQAELSSVASPVRYG